MNKSINEKICFIYNILNIYIKNEDNFVGNKTKKKVLLNLNENNKLHIFSIKNETKKKDFQNLLSKFNNETKNNVSIFDSNKEIFKIEMNKLLIMDGWNKEIIKNDLLELESKILKKRNYNKKEEKALIQNTHSHKNSSFDFFLLISPQNNQMVVLKINNDFIEFEKKIINDNINEIIIIENKECFFRYKEFLNTKYFENLPDLKSVLIIYGEGNSISNKKLEDFFKKFKKIHCFFDYDQGGFQIFKNLKHNNKIFHYPKQNILKNVIELIYYHQEINYNKLIITKIEDSSFLNYYHEAILDVDIIKNKKELIQIEQEIFLLNGLENIENYKK